MFDVREQGPRMVKSLERGSIVSLICGDRRPGAGPLAPGPAGWDQGRRKRLSRRAHSITSSARPSSATGRPSREPLDFEAGGRVETVIAIAAGAVVD
jgi:hypothetical protein